MSAPVPERARPDRRERLAAHVEIHDPLQLEIRFGYAIGSAHLPQRYTVETYLFVPKNVGLDRTNYTRDQFYADVRPLMRLDAARLSLAALADPTHAASPLRPLSAALEAFQSGGVPPDANVVRINAKLYAHLFSGAIKAELQRTARALRRGVPDEPDARASVERDLEATLDRARRALGAWRAVRGGLWPFERAAHASLAEAMRAADERMSLVLEERLAALVEALDAATARADTGGLAARCRLRAGALAREEAAYRRRYGYALLGRRDARRDEYFAYRASLLKRNVHQALYLEARHVQSDTFLRNAIGAVGAALAAIWAWAAQVPSTLARVSGNTKLLVFAMAVSAYVLKDRIKVLTNESLTRRLRRFDHVAWLTGASLTAIGLGAMRARVREAMRFARDTEVPADVRALRLAERTVRGAEGGAEEVIHYRKIVDIDADDARHELAAGYGVRDILRLNVRHFLVRLDEPRDRVAYFDAEREAFAHTDVPKVYHLNAVIKIVREDASGRGTERLDRFRVVLDKHGIVRAEAVASQGPVERAAEQPPRLRAPRGG